MQTQMTQRSDPGINAMMVAGGVFACVYYDSRDMGHVWTANEWDVHTVNSQTPAPRHASAKNHASCTIMHDVNRTHEAF